MNSRIMIAFDYNGHIGNIELEPFKPVYLIKEKAFNLYKKLPRFATNNSKA